MDLMLRILRAVGLSIAVTTTVAIASVALERGDVSIFIGSSWAALATAWAISKEIIV